MNVNMYIYMYVCVCMYVWTYVYMYLYMYVGTHYARTHSRTYTHARKPVLVVTVIIKSVNYSKATSYRQ
jgi:hypothetical protein